MRLLPGFLSDLFTSFGLSLDMPRPMPGGRSYGHRSRRYDGPRDPRRRKLRPALTRARIKALNVAWHRAAA